MAFCSKAYKYGGFGFAFWRASDTETKKYRLGLVRAQRRKTSVSCSLEYKTTHFQDVVCKRCDKRIWLDSLQTSFSERKGRFYMKKCSPACK